MLLLQMSYYSLLRMLRQPIGLLLLVVLPLIIISVVGVVLSGELSGVEGVPGLDWTAVSTIMAVQFFGGTYLMSFVNDDLLRTRRWRMLAIPMNVAIFSTSHILACTLFSVIQGAVLVGFTKWVFGVEWGHLGWVFLVLLVFSVLSQFVHLVLLLSVRSFRLAERLSEVLGIGFILLTGVMFPLPDNDFFQFMSSYGNPVGLGQIAIFERLEGGSQAEAFLAVSLLMAASILLLIISVWLGRRKLA